MSNPPISSIEYKLVRSKRKTLAIAVDADGVTVKAPMTTSKERIDGFVESKRKWILTKLGEKSLINLYFADVLAERSVLYHGEFLEIECDSVKYITANGGKLLVPNRYAENAQARMRAVIKWFRLTAEGELRYALSEQSGRTGLKYAEFDTTNAKGKWGSCDSRNNIRLNWRLVMLEPALMRYVIVHELAHTVYHDHKKEFWRLVSEHEPNYAAENKRLDDFAILTRLYR